VPPWHGKNKLPAVLTLAFSCWRHVCNVNPKRVLPSATCTLIEIPILPGFLLLEGGMRFNGKDMFCFNLEGKDMFCHLEDVGDVLLEKNLPATTVQKNS